MVLNELGARIGAALAQMSNAATIDEKVLDDCLKEISNALVQVRPPPSVACRSPMRGMHAFTSVRAATDTQEKSSHWRWRSAWAPPAQHACCSGRAVTLRSPQFVCDQAGKNVW